MKYFFSNYLEIKETPKGKKTFAKIKFNKDDVIYEFMGEKLKDVIPEDYLCTQIGKNIFLKPSGLFEDYTNHSCNPNAFIKIVGNRAFLTALCLINIGDEVTWDYSCSSTEDKSTFNMNCSCHKFLCRKEISGFQYLADEQKQKYIEMGIVPDYLLVK